MYGYTNSKRYININGKTVENKDVKIVLNNKLMNVDINDNGEKKNYEIKLNNSILNKLKSSSLALENRLEKDFMRENKKPNFSPYPFQKMEIIILPKNNLKKKIHTKKKSKKSKKSKKNKSKKAKKV
jgi:hypothetical protein